MTIETRQAYTVKELIEELKMFPADASVYLSKAGCKYSWMCTAIEDDDLDIDACITLSGGKQG